MATWPGTLPDCPLLAGFSMGAPNTVLRSSTTIGPPLTRRQGTAGVRPIDASVIIQTLALRDVLDDFFLNDCQGGAIPFFWATLSSYTGGGTGEFLWLGPPDYRPTTGQIWTAAMSLVRLP